MLEPVLFWPKSPRTTVRPPDSAASLTTDMSPPTNTLTELSRSGQLPPLQVQNPAGYGASGAGTAEAGMVGTMTKNEATSNNIPIGAASIFLGSRCRPLGRITPPLPDHPRFPPSR